ncbi:MAG: hypothetical protein JRG71_14440 [Deltaproteobacteria bacterium]|nr:hypothetical protein [Deltaproteobacteria bacterium]
MMREQDVPQDVGVLEENRVVAYAVDEQGNYCLKTTVGWEPVNEAAWDDIKEQLDEVRVKIESGKSSVLAYYMTRAQMDRSLLASYSGLSTWRVWRHLKPGPFKKMSAEDRQTYANLFRVPVAQLSQLPVTDSLPTETPDTL